MHSKLQLLWGFIKLQFTTLALLVFSKLDFVTHVSQLGAGLVSSPYIKEWARCRHGICQLLKVQLHRAH